MKNFTEPKITIQNLSELDVLTLSSQEAKTIISGNVSDYGDGDFVL